ncbi:MAG: hypothetical protein ACOCXA_05805 [Planctomycetota bacterium]
MPETPDPAEQLRSLQAWVSAHCDYGDRVRTEMGRTAIGSILRRCIFFGQEDSLRHYDCRELLQFLLLLIGPSTVTIARMALSMAFAEDDRAVIQVYVDNRIFVDQLAWWQEREQADLEQARDLCEQTLEAEERSVCRLVCARRHPELITPAWLQADVDSHPRLLALLARLTAARRPDLQTAVIALLLDRRDILFALEPDPTLELLVLNANQPPQALLQPFEGMYGEGCLAAAAEWHLQHEQYGAVHQLCTRIRPLSPQADRARAIACLALLAEGRAHDAAQLRQQIVTVQHADAVDLRLAEMQPLAVADERIITIAEQTPNNRPERFVAGLRLLLQRKRLDAARRVAQQRRCEFVDHAVAIQIIDTILGAGAGA